MKVTDMRTKTVKQLDAHADKLRQQIAEATRDKLTLDKNNSPEIKAFRKELAQTLTLKKEVQVSESKTMKEESK